MSRFIIQANLLQSDKLSVERISDRKKERMCVSAKFCDSNLELNKVFDLKKFFVNRTRIVLGSIVITIGVPIVVLKYNKIRAIICLHIKL